MKRPNVNQVPCPAPILVLQRGEPAYTENRPRNGVLVINFNTARQTQRCIASLLRNSIPPDSIWVLDNASEAADYEALLHFVETDTTCNTSVDLRIYRSETNLGFASGSNFLIYTLLDSTNSEYVILLNNDAVAQVDMLENLTQCALQAPSRTGLVGGRMHRLDAPAVVDTLGISIYRSLMPADRKSTHDRLIGPTGGCCLMTRECLQHLHHVSGYIFDPRFFCYCEDTDLALRALLLGYEPAYTDTLLALHEGQASSGGGFNSFIAYHGIRNSIWMHAKVLPTHLLLKYGPLLLLAHLLSCARHLLAGRFRLLLKIYTDAFRQIGSIIEERRHLLAHTKIDLHAFEARITPRFYRRDYLRSLMRWNAEAPFNKPNKH